MLDFLKPTVDEAINRLTYNWKDYDLKIVADRISDDGEAELWFYHCNSKGDSLLHTTKTNLMSTSTTNQLIKRMGLHSTDIPWADVLTFVVSNTMLYQRRGEPYAILQPVPGTTKHPGYYIEPIVLKGLPTIIHGEKGINKTTLCLALLGLIAIGVDDSSDNPLELIATEQANVGILDWENDKDTTLYTISRLIEGKTIPYFEPAYLKCYQPLHDDIDRIANFINDNKIKVVLIDSLGQAAGSDQYDQAGKRAALKFFEDVRKLNITSITIGQEAKNEEGKKTIYGSVYYRYYARNIFELKGKSDDLDQNINHLALFHTDANYSRKYEPIGFRITYSSDDAAKIEREEVKLSEFLEKASQTKNILAFLSDGAKSLNEIMTQLGTTSNTTRNALSRLKNKGLVINLGSSMWGLTTNDEENES